MSKKLQGTFFLKKKKRNKKTPHQYPKCAWNAKVQNVFFFNFSPFKLMSWFWGTWLLVAEIIRLKVPWMSAGKEISLLTGRSVLQRCCHAIDFFWSLHLYYWLSQQWRYFLYFFVSVLLGSRAEAQSLPFLFVFQVFYRTHIADQKIPLKTDEKGHF